MSGSVKDMTSFSTFSASVCHSSQHGSKILDIVTFSNDNVQKQEEMNKLLFLFSYISLARYGLYLPLLIVRRMAKKIMSILDIIMEGRK